MLKVLDGGRLRLNTVLSVKKAEFSVKGGAFDPSKRAKVEQVVPGCDAAAIIAAFARPTFTRRAPYVETPRCVARLVARLGYQVSAAASKVAKAAAAQALTWADDDDGNLTAPSKSANNEPS